MAWTTPKTWLAGELVTETSLNTYIRDNQTVLKTSIDANGKLVALTSSYVADLDGSNLTGIPTLAGDNAWTGENDFSGGAFVLPVGTDQWAT